MRQAAVALVSSSRSADDAVLVAYLVPAEIAEIEAIRGRLRERLPDYLIPDRFVLVEGLPLTLNGKVDRHALAALPASGDAASAPPGDAAGAAGAADPAVSGESGEPDSAGGPATGTEQALAAIWCDVLAVRDIGREDNFFDLGGQSLQASRMVSRMRSALGVEVPLGLVFDHPTVAELARLIDEAA